MIKDGIIDYIYKTEFNDNYSNLQNSTQKIEDVSPKQLIDLKVFNKKEIN